MLIDIVAAGRGGEFVRLVAIALVLVLAGAVGVRWCKEQGLGRIPDHSKNDLLVILVTVVMVFFLSVWMIESQFRAHHILNTFGSARAGQPPQR